MNDYAMATACGGACTVVAGNRDAIPVVSFMAGAMGLAENGSSAGGSRLQVEVWPEVKPAMPGTGEDSGNGDFIVCRISPADQQDLLATQMIWLSPFFVQAIESRGGVLIHGALAERDGCGVIFAGPGGIGKSTVSRRLPPPWRSLSDDMTLIERGDDGRYLAHPWPTWSRFMWGGPGGTWDVSRAVPLKAVYILDKAEHTECRAVGTGQAAMLLQEVADQASFFAYDNVDRDRARNHRTARFNSVCGIAFSVPVSILMTSLSQPFAHLIHPCPHS